MDFMLRETLIYGRDLWILNDNKRNKDLNKRY